ncbi:polysaccharide biosynthesis tyrosine autokinase [Myxococcota bacterium]|nr:polysaccharide biosynthesis tyrosine autokinase [Myxococcota bacterium]
MELVKLWTILKRRKWLLVQSFAFFVLAAAVASYFIPKSYQSTSKVMIEQSDASASLLSEIGLQELVQSLGASSSSTIQNKIALAATTEVLDDAVWRLQIRSDAGDLMKPGDLLASGITAMVSPKPGYKIAQYQNTDFLTITATALDADSAKIMADTLADVFIEISQERMREETRSAKKFIDDRIDVVQKEFQSALSQIADYQTNQNIIDLQSETKAAVSRLSELMGLAEEAEVQISGLRQKVKETERILGTTSPGAVMGSSMQGNPQIAQINKALTDQRLKLNELLLDRTTNHPDVINIRQQIATTEQELASVLEVEKATAPNLNQYKIDLAAAISSRNQIQAGIAGLTEKFSELPNKMMNNGQLELAAEASQGIYKALVDYQYQIGIAEAMTLTDIRLVEKAALPDKFVSPKIIINTLAGAVLGLMFGIGLIFVFEYIDDTIRNREDLEEVWDLTSLGVIPRVRSNQARLISEISPKDPLVEAYRTIRNGVLYASLDEPVRTLMVTSSIPGEGKSTTTANLAVSVAIEGKRVLIIDTDFRRPSQHKIWKVSATVGITSLLVGEASIEDCIQSTSVPNLDVLPAGPVPPNPAKLIESRRMRQVMDELKATYDLVILDSPPLLVVNDAIPLARYVDCFVLVVESMKVSRKMILDIRQRLEVAHLEPLGVVLNKLDFGIAGYNYYYKYYSVYGEEKIRRQAAAASGEGKGPRKGGGFRLLKS